MADKAQRDTKMHIVTGNRLTDGAVIFLSTGGVWVERVRSSRVVTGKEEAEALLAEAEQDVIARKVVGPYLIDVRVADDGLWPTKYRERIRAFGPSIHPEFAKQA